MPQTASKGDHDRESPARRVQLDRVSVKETRDEVGSCEVVIHESRTVRASAVRVKFW